MNRQEVLSHLRETPEVSVLVIGGGINGIGVFRELALNGVDVLLVERADFCSGASAASSRMANGGLRYLEDGEFGLVREAVRERDLLIRNAPHLVRPLPTTIPLFKRVSGLLNTPLKRMGLLERPAERGSLAVKLGLMLYDSYSNRSAQDVVPRHAFLSKKASLKKWQGLNPAIVAAATYHDGLLLDPERLAVELLLDAEQENSSAHALNYLSMVGGMEDTIILRDELTDENFDVKPKLVINASGAWVDASNRKLGLSSRFIGGVKGSHIVVDHEGLRAALSGHAFVFEGDDGHQMSLLPLGDRVLVGATHIPMEDPEDVTCTEPEMDALLGAVRRVFPSLNLTRQNVVFHFSGIRPLRHSGVKAVSRTHSIEVLSGEWTGLAFPVYSLAGGAWTSFRAFSGQAADKALDFLGLKRAKDTRSLAIGGGRGYLPDAADLRWQIESLSAWTGVSRERLQVLFERYGTRAEAVATFMNGGTDRLLRTLPDYSLRELLFVISREKVFHLDDFLLRRSLLAMLGRLTRETVDELAGVFATALGWTKEHRAAEAARALSILADRHGLKL